MSYQITLGQWKSVFAVPSSVVDQHIKIASEAQLKTLLYLLRHSDEELTDEQLASALRLSADEVRNAVDFWIERGLLSKSDHILTPSAFVNEQPAAVTSKPQIEEEKPKKQHTMSRAQRPDPMFVSKLLQQDTDLAGLMEEAQTVLQKPLSSGDTGTLVMLYDSFGLPCAVIALLLNYLASIGCANMRDVERYGIRWADNGIKTVEDAEREIERLTTSREAWGSVSKLLGIRNVGNPTKAQLENAHRWVVTWNFSDEMIVEAYERCVNIKGEYNISYINAILKRWHEKGIKSMDALREAEAASKNKQKSNTKKNAKGSVFSVEGASFDVNKYKNTSLFDD
ncbi:MAG: DnaD domain protein [Ruminococcus sp.]|uniref:DnaD domain protein n=1 Tax=Ruminococcus sp. TaxID=41978 RepID=UPI0028733975|nr:DnaD domain protein [Ruminococcus sp.]MBQ3284089.1 DnaD domain protein [Ruminococcus sp.]